MGSDSRALQNPLSERRPSCIILRPVFGLVGVGRNVWTGYGVGRFDRFGCQTFCQNWSTNLPHFPPNLHQFFPNFPHFSPSFPHQNPSFPHQNRPLSKHSPTPKSDDSVVFLKIERKSFPNSPARPIIILGQVGKIGGSWASWGLVIIEDGLGFAVIYVSWEQNKLLSDLRKKCSKLA